MTPRKPLRLAYFSPLPPRRTGIADYSLTLLRSFSRLRDRLEIDLWIDGDQQEPDLPGLELRRCRYDGRGETIPALDSYDLCVFQMGNQVEHHRAILDVSLRYQGLVVLHDYVLHHMLARLRLHLERDPEGYVAEMAEAHGADGERLARQAVAGRAARPWETPRVLDYPLNARVVRASRAVVVHSRFAAARLRQAHPGHAVYELPMPVPEHPVVSRETARRRLGFPPDAFVVGAFGFVTPPKRIPSLLRAVALMAPELPIHCLVVGEIQQPDLHTLVRELDLEDRVRLTGFVSEAELREHLTACDAAVNLRNPTLGEASASVCRILAAARPCAVSDAGWFRELPDSVVEKIPVDGSEHEALVACLRRWYEAPACREELGEAAARYMSEEHAAAPIAKRFAALFEKIAAQSSSGRARGRKAPLPPARVVAGFPPDRGPS